MAEKPDRDPVTGHPTTGHEWDGIRELNTPLPKWWVYVFFATIVWAVVFWILYPSWPTLSGYNEGLLEWNDHRELRRETAAVTAERARFRDRIAWTTPAAIEADPDLQAFAMISGEALFNETCSPCHQIGGVGTEGYPSLVDDRWIWGGTSDRIYRTIRYGVRNDNPNSRDPDKAGMQDFGGLLSADEIRDVAAYVADALSQGKDGTALPGHPVFVENCVLCHGGGGQGDQIIGAPPLNTPFGWTFRRGGESLRDTAIRQVTSPNKGSMPDWTERLSDAVVKELTVYVHTLGGGQ